MKAALVAGPHEMRGNRRERRAEARSKAVRPYLRTGVALAAIGAVTVGAVASVDPARSVQQTEARAQLDIRSADIQLAATSSILNIPLNLLADIVNMPNSALQAFDLLASAQLWGGQWIVTGPSNIWGTDPADAARFVAAASMLFPIPALSGFNTEISPANPLGVLGGDGIGQQFWRFMAAQVPVSPYCDAEGCVPTLPTSPITGIRSIDNLVWNVMIFTGTVHFPLTDGWFRVPPSKLVNGTFDPATTYVEDPSGEIYTLDGFGIPGTYKGPNNENLMPWAGTPINLNLAKPFENWFNHLKSDPFANPIKLPSLVQLGRALQTLAAGIVVGFDPITPGSSLCPGWCEGLPPQYDYPAIVKWIGSLWPGNQKIDTWLAAYEAGRANTPTGQYITQNIELLKNSEKFWDFSNPPLDPQFSKFGFNPSDLAPSFYKLWTSLGLHPDPLYPVNPSAAVAPVKSQPLAAASVAAPSTPAASAVEPQKAQAHAAEGIAAGDAVADLPAAAGDAVPDLPAPAGGRVRAGLNPAAVAGKAETAAATHAGVGRRGPAGTKSTAGTGRGAAGPSTPDKETAEAR